MSNLTSIASKQNKAEGQDKMLMTYRFQLVNPLGYSAKIEGSKEARLGNPIHLQRRRPTFPLNKRAPGVSLLLPATHRHCQKIWGRPGTDFGQVKSPIQHKQWSFDEVKNKHVERRPQFSCGILQSARYDRVRSSNLLAFFDFLLFCFPPNQFLPPYVARRNAFHSVKDDWLCLLLRMISPP